MARQKNRKAKLGEKPAMKLQTEYQMIEIISGALRPMRSAIQQTAIVAPPRRIHNVTANTAVTAVSGTPNSLLIGSMMRRKMVKSNASNVHPIQAAKSGLPLVLGGFPPPGQRGRGRRSVTDADIC